MKLLNVNTEVRIDFTQGRTKSCITQIDVFGKMTWFLAELNWRQIKFDLTAGRLTTYTMPIPCPLHPTRTPAALL